MVKLSRRNDVPDRGWVAFVFEHNDQRYLGFVHHDTIATDGLTSAVTAFDREQERILELAAAKVDAGEFDKDGRVHLKIADLAGKQRFGAVA